MTLGFQLQLSRDFVQVSHCHPSYVTNGSVIGPIEFLEDIGRAVAARHIDDLVRGDCASPRQILAIGCKPDLRLAMIDLASTQLSVFRHEASLLDTQFGTAIR